MEGHDLSEDKRKAGKIGGAKRAEILPATRRSEIAKRAALARWGAKATHKGSFKNDFGIDVDCYVLDDAQKTAVMSQRGMAEALGLAAGSGGRLPSFIQSERMAAYVGRELREKLENPIIFQGLGAVAGNPGSTVHGYDATILIDLCRAVLAAEAEGRLAAARYANVVRQAHIIVGASAKAGITHLVYALAGYNPTAEEVIAAFKLYVQEEARKYEPEFPNELYLQWHRLYDLAVPKRGKPWHFKSLTVRHVYYPLAKSNGKILELLKALKSQDGDRAKKLFQFLNEIGARALRIQLGRVLEMAESSPDKFVYENKIAERFGGQKELELYVPTPSTVPTDGSMKEAAN
ncbi:MULTISPECIES: P63C domain-containing protein [unclassified Bradyrhizobium]|uniref:P63C domain-containing protein n=1 Tax=unclassified Bradyrhizobium TaxID=2631580 RepID=UPI002916D109|nr:MULTISPECIES: P63C domain-containing protein [unclassified Bradyrhizobium]